MRKLLIFIFLTIAFIFPVNSVEITVPSAPAEIEKYMPEESVSFGKDLLYILKGALAEVTPEIAEGISICAAVIVIQMLVSILQNCSGISKKVVTLTGIIGICTLLLTPSKAMLQIGIETIEKLYEYNKLLLPVMTAALAAQGGSTTSAALYAGTIVIDTILTTIISKVLLPLLYGYIALGIASVAIDEPILKKLLALVKWIMTWLLKLSIYLFTGYMTITGVVSGTVDSAALKATKLTISGSVPVIGNIISDASEAILVSAGIVKNTAGIYGAMVIITIWIVPFLKIGIQYLMLKLTAGFSSLFAEKATTNAVEHISTVMGFILAMIGTICLLLLISIVCFMKGMNG